MLSVLLDPMKVCYLLVENDDVLTMPRSDSWLMVAMRCIGCSRVELLQCNVS